MELEGSPSGRWPSIAQRTSEEKVECLVSNTRFAGKWASWWEAFLTNGTCPHGPRKGTVQEALLYLGKQPALRNVNAAPKTQARKCGVGRHLCQCAGHFSRGSPPQTIRHSQGLDQVSVHGGPVYAQYSASGSGIEVCSCHSHWYGRLCGECISCPRRSADLVAFQANVFSSVNCIVLPCGSTRETPVTMG